MTDVLIVTARLDLIFQKEQTQMLHPRKVKPGDFARQLSTGVYQGEEVMKVVIVSGSGDLVVEHPSGDLAVCKANELQIANDEAA